MELLLIVVSCSTHHWENEGENDEYIGNFAIPDSGTDEKRNGHGTNIHQHQNQQEDEKLISLHL